MGTSSKPSINSRVSYEVPDTSNYLYRKDKYQTNWSRNKKNKQSYIDLIMVNAKRPDRYVPGPSDYKPEKVVIPTTKRFKWDSEKRMTLIDRIQREEKQKVGPAQYSFDQVYQDKIKGVYMQQKAVKEGLTGEVEYLSLQTPCAN